MSLDFTILDERHLPKREAGLASDEHLRLIANARRLNIKSFERLSDYYGDAIFETEELGQLSLDLDKLCQELSSEDGLLATLRDIQDIVEQARKDGSKVHVLAD